MSIKVISLIWEDHTGFLTGIEKSVLMRLADFGSDDGTGIYPGKNRLVLDTGFCLTTIKKTLSDLQKKKILIAKNRKDKVQNITNLYTINVKILKELSQKSSVDKIEKGRAPHALGRAPRALGGRAPRAPDPLDSNRYINNNREKPVDKPKLDPSWKCPVVAFLDNEMTELGIVAKDRKHFLESYSQERIKRAIAVTKQKPRENAPGFFRASLANGWTPVSVSNKKPSSNRLIESTKAELKKREENLKRAASPESIKAGKEALSKLKAGLATGDFECMITQSDGLKKKTAPRG